MQDLCLIKFVLCDDDLASYSDFYSWKWFLLSLRQYNSDHTKAGIQGRLGKN